MPKIRGKFAPMFEELGNDHRWLMELNDFEKLLYQLILCTIYWNNGTAPDDPRYYKLRYSLRHRTNTIAAGLEHVKAVYPKLISNNKTLSLLNAVAYKNTVVIKGSGEVEREVEVEGKGYHHTFPLEEIKLFFKDRGVAGIEAVSFFNRYESLGWKSGNSMITNWRPLAQNWILRIKPDETKKKSKHLQGFPST